MQVADDGPTCRFCLQPATDRQCLVSPCACRGSMKYVHQACVLDAWAARGDWRMLGCPTCHQNYSGWLGVEVATQALEVCREEFGTDSLEDAEALHNLANAYGAYGDAESHRVYLEEALNIVEREHGPDHPEVSAALNDLGIAYRDLGDVFQAKQLLERALLITEKSFGADHAEVAGVLTNLGGTYDAFGDYASAQAALERSLEIKERERGQFHVGLAPVLINLACVHTSLGNLDAAEELLQRALQIMERAYGPDHREVAVVLANIGSVHSERGNASLAKEFLERALRIKEFAFGPDHREVAVLVSNLGCVHCNMGDAFQGKELFARALAIYDRELGIDHTETAGLLTNIGNAYCELDNPSAAKGILERALVIKEDWYGPEHAELAITLTHLGWAYYALGDPLRSKEILERGLAISERVFGSQHRETAHTLINLGCAYNGLENVDCAKNLLERARAIREKECGPQHGEVAVAFTHLGDVHRKLGELELAQATLEVALRIHESSYGTEHFVVALTLHNLAQVSAAMGDLGRKDSLEARALEIRSSIRARLGEHDDLLQLLKRSGECNDRWKKTDTYGRLAVVRPALVLTVAAGILLQTAGSFGQALVARFVLGLVSGGLLTVMPPLIAELLPSRHRGFYLTVWCCGWPAGSLFALMLGSAVPGLSWHEFYTMALTPAAFVYITVRVDMLLESPRFLYMAGRTDEGYNVLLDMYEKEELPLPWAQESISVTCAPPKPAIVTKGGRNKATSYVAVTFWLSLAMFLASAAAQSVTLWIPTMLIAHRADERAGTFGHMNEVVDMSMVNMENPMGFAAGPRALSLLATVGAPLMLPDPDFVAVRVLAESYMVEIFGIVVCAYMSSWVTRKQMVQWPLLAAAVLTVLNIFAAGGRFGAVLCGPIVGAQLSAQAAGLNFLQVFASEYFPTSRRAQTVAIATFAAQLGALLVPVVGGYVIRRTSPAAAVAFFSTLYIMAWATSFRLPLSTGPERPLHDVDEEPKTKRSGAVDARKREWPTTTYQTI